MGVCQFGSEESQGTREVQDGKQLSHGNSFMEQVFEVGRVEFHRNDRRQPSGIPALVGRKQCESQYHLCINPFTKVFTGRAKTEKRSITQADILRLHALSLPPDSSLALARDIFIFSFYAMGMPFVDIAYLRKEQIKDGVMFYDRHKTRQRIQVTLLPPMTDIIHRYELAHSDFVFPILVSNKDVCSHTTSESLASEQLHRIYLRRLRQYNYSLRRLSEMLGSHIHLSSYVVRHSWASIAYQHHFDIGLIGRALGHTKQSTTLLYIKSLETSDLGTANHTLMEELGL